MPRRPSQDRSGIPRTALAVVLDEQGRRLAWVASRLEVDASTVSRWCSGDRPLPARRRVQLATILGVGADDLRDPTHPDQVITQ